MAPPSEAPGEGPRERSDLLAGAGRTLIEHSQTALALLSAEGVVRYASPALQALLGCASAEPLGLPLDDLVHPEDLPARREQWRGLLAAPGGHATGTLRLRRKGGSWRWCE